MTTALYTVSLYRRFIFVSASTLFQYFAENLLDVTAKSRTQRSSSSEFRHFDIESFLVFWFFKFRSHWFTVQRITLYGFFPVCNLFFKSTFRKYIVLIHSFHRVCLIEGRTKSAAWNPFRPPSHWTREKKTLFLVLQLQLFVSVDSVHGSHYLDDGSTKMFVDPVQGNLFIYSILQFL